jgi:hypothetical protein
VKNLSKKTVDILPNPSIIVSVKGTKGADHDKVGGESSAVRSPKTFSKKFQKSLDKPHKVWYNKDTPKGVKQIAPKRAERGIL